MTISSLTLVIRALKLYIPDMNKELYQQKRRYLRDLSPGDDPIHEMVMDGGKIEMSNDSNVKMEEGVGGEGKE
jgi:hypothetical protein